MNGLRRNYFPIYKDFGSLLDNFLNNQTDDATFGDLSKWAPAVDIKEEKLRTISSYRYSISICKFWWKFFNGQFNSNRDIN